MKYLNLLSTAILAIAMSSLSACADENTGEKQEILSVQSDAQLATDRSESTDDSKQSQDSSQNNTESASNNSLEESLEESLKDSSESTVDSAQPVESTASEQAEDSSLKTLSTDKAQEINMRSATYSVNKLAFDLYAKLRKNGENLFFSPYSISSALAMTYAGAKGETAQQMEKSLYFNEGIHAAFSTLTKSLDAEDTSLYELNIANALWRQVDEMFIEEYIALLAQYYNADKQVADFKTDTEKARQEINTWVEEKTQGKIKELIKSGVLTKLTQLVLTNAIYFKGSWTFPFIEKKTRKMPFKLNESDTVKADMMTQKTSFLNYLDTEDMQLLELPYQINEKETEALLVKEGLSMVIILPKAVNGLKALMDNKGMDSVMQNIHSMEMYNGKIHILLPKFKLSSGFSLKQVLKDLGVIDAFDYDKADFSGMNEKAQNLAISEAIHKAFVEVNEKGTEAAAATGIAMGLRSISPPPINFHADHPFLFLIRDMATDTILFMGQVADPSKE